jgi:hypothetical protein
MTRTLSVCRTFLTNPRCLSSIHRKNHTSNKVCLVGVQKQRGISDVPSGSHFRANAVLGIGKRQLISDGVHSSLRRFVGEENGSKRRSFVLGSRIFAPISRKPRRASRHKHIAECNKQNRLFIVSRIFTQLANAKQCKFPQTAPLSRVKKKTKPSIVRQRVTIRGHCKTKASPRLRATTHIRQLSLRDRS